MEGKVSVPPKNKWKQMGRAETTVAVHEEMKRVQQLPANSTYATHRLRVLNKILQLLSIQKGKSKRTAVRAVPIPEFQKAIDVFDGISSLWRTASQEEELELLFAGLSL